MYARCAYLEIPLVKSISNKASLNGGANLFLATLTRTWLPTTSSPKRMS